MEKDGLVEEGFLVVVRRQPVAGGDELASGFRVVRFVGIPERGRSEAPEEDDEDERRCQTDEAALFDPCGRRVHRDGSRLLRLLAIIGRSSNRQERHRTVELTTWSDR